MADSRQQPQVGAPDDINQTIATIVT